MPPTLREIRQLSATKAMVDYTERKVAHDAVRSAALSAEKLLGDPNWDRYLMRLQALLEEVTVARAQWMERCTGALSENDIRIAQLNYQACDARMKTLVEVMALPKQLVEAVHGDNPLPRGDGYLAAGAGEPV